MPVPGEKMSSTLSTAAIRYFAALLSYEPDFSPGTVRDGGLGLLNHPLRYA
jgi:hypothetical protein